MYRWNTTRLEYEFRRRLTGLADDTTPELGGDLDLNSSAIVAQLTAGETLAADDVCYLNSNGKMYKADASQENTASGMVAVCTEALSASGEGAFVLKGFYTTTGLTIGSIVWLSTTAGGVTDTVPVGSGEIVRILGYAISATQLFFDPDKTWLENA